MKLTFLGTSAGESYPGLWCECPHCSYARKHGGKNIRSNSCAVIDEDLMLDCGPTCFDNAVRFGVNLTRATKLLITHPHEDHFYPQHLRWRMTNEDNILLSYTDKMHKGGPRFSQVPELHVYGTERTKNTLLARGGESLKEMRIQFHQIEAGVTMEMDDYRITPVRNNHGPEAGFSYSYVIEKGGRTMLYALDTGDFEEEMLPILQKFRYNVIVMEGTTGLNEQYGGHMCLVNNIKWKKYFQKNGCTEPDCRFILTHMSPHWCPPHDWYETIAGAEGILIAYDGYQIDV